MNVLRFIKPAFVVLLVAFLAVGLYNCESEGDTTAAETQASIGVTPEQVVSQYDSVFISGVTSPDQGWLVLRRGDNDGPDMSAHLLAPLQVEAGYTSDTAFVINSIDVGDEEKLWVTLHEDAGSQGTYEGDGGGADPQYQEDGQPVQKSIIIHAPSVEAADQIVANNEVTLTNVKAGTPSWMVIHDRAAAGGPGAIVSVTAVSEGMHDELTVSLDDSLVYADGDTLYPMLHIDAGEEGTFEFPGADAPEIFGQNGDVIVTSFQVTGATAVMEVSDHVLSQNSLTFDSTDADYPHWLVFHDDAAGNPGPIVSDTVSVSAGGNSNMMVAFQPMASMMPAGTYHPMIHIDNGTIGTFEFPAVDSLGTRIFDGPLTVDMITVSAPMVTANNQSLIPAASDTVPDSVAVASATIGVDGWMVIHEDDGQGNPGPILGQTWIEAGDHTDIIVPLSQDTTATITTLHAMLHIDAGEAGVFEFPDGDDVPEVYGWDVDGNAVIVMDPFELQ